MWNSIWIPILTAILGALVPTVAWIFRYKLGSTKEQNSNEQFHYTRLETRITYLETEHSKCLDEKGDLARDLGQMRGEMAGMKASMFRLESQGTIGHVICDQAGVIREWNPGATDILQWSSAEAIGQSVAMIVPPRLRGDHDRAFDRAVVEKRGPLTTSNARLRETHGLRKDGSEVPLIITLVGWEHKGERMFAAELKRR